jgi:ATP-binding cassette subfamily C protein CydD
VTQPAKNFLRDQQRHGRIGAVLACFWGFCAALIGIGQVFCVALLLADALNGDIVPDTPPLMGYVLGALLRAGFLLLSDQAAFAAGAAGRTRLRRDIFTRLLATGPSLLRRYHSAELTNLAIDRIEALDGLFARWMPASMLAIAAPAAVLATSFIISKRAGFIMLAGGIFVPFSQAVAGIGAQRASEKQFLALERLQTRFLDRIRGIATIVLSGAAAREAKTLGHAADELRMRIMLVLRVAFLSSAAIDCAMAAVLIGITITSAAALKPGHSTMPALALLLLVPEFFAPLRAFGLAYQDRMQAVGAAETLATLPEAPPPPKARQIRTIEARGIAVTFEDVRFTWDASRGPALDGVSFFAGAGEFVVLAGKSGAGKSTIIELLLGFIRPESGRIKLNGLDMADIVPSALTELTAWIGQKPTLFAATIAENISFAKPGATRAEIEDAARAAQIMDFAEHLPRGLETRIGEGGHGLSGGQAQRVAIARAFLKNAPLLLMDEPTVHLDPLTESAVLDSIKRLALGRTVIMASHSAAAHGFGGRRIDIADGRVVGGARGAA